MLRVREVSLCICVDKYMYYEAIWQQNLWGFTNPECHVAVNQYTEKLQSSELLRQRP